MGRYPAAGLLKPLSSGDRGLVNDAMALLRIDDLADRQVAKLSGGQRQRVFVAQALAQDHTILFMDEPLTGLDIQSAQTIDDIMHEEPARGCSVVFTTHDLEEARAADHVILVSGYVVAEGAPWVCFTRRTQRDLGYLMTLTTPTTPTITRSSHETQYEAARRSLAGP
jgi:manganese transport system ATP-binding protein